MAGEPLPLLLTYRSGKGEVTERRVDAVRVDAYDGWCVIHAYCHLRHRYRTFISRNIITMVDLRTGEVLDATAADMHLRTIVADWLD